MKTFSFATQFGLLNAVCRFLIPLVVLIFSLNCQAASVNSNCETVSDVAPNLGTVYNQGGDLNWCYAYAASDLVTDRLQKTGLLQPNQRIHPIALAALYHIDDHRSPSHSKQVLASTPAVFNALDWYRDHGFAMCTENEFGGPADRENPLFREADLAELQKLSALKAQRCRTGCDAGNKTAADLAELEREVAKVSRDLWLSELRKRCHTAIPVLLQTFQTYQEKFDHLEHNEVLKWRPDVNSSIQSIIDLGLKKDRPVAINYQISFMMAKKTVGMHWSSIVGRKMIDGKCHYRLRGSFGPDCSPYSEPKKCEKGYLWVERDNLLRHTSSSVYLE